MTLWTPQESRMDSDERARHAFRDYVQAVNAAVDASRAFTEAPPHEKLGAHARLIDAMRRQSDAERAYERAREAAAGAAYAGRPRLSRR